MPVHFRVRGNVCIIVTNSAVDFPQHFNAFQLTKLTLETVCHVRHLFTQRRRRCRLTMGTGKQRNIAVLHGQVFHGGDDLGPVRHDHFTACGFQHQCVRQVVDVFRGTGEVDELRNRMQRRVWLHLLFQEVLNRFYIMVGGAFDGFDARCIFHAKVADNRIEESVCVGIKCRNFLDLCAGGQFL